MGAAVTLKGTAALYIKETGPAAPGVNAKAAARMNAAALNLVEPIGIEPTTSTMPLWRSSN